MTNFAGLPDQTWRRVRDTTLPTATTPGGFLSYQVAKKVTRRTNPGSTGARLGGSISCVSREYALPASLNSDT